MTDEKKETKKRGPGRGLVAMCKDGETIKVNKACVAAHEARGWARKKGR